MNDGHRIISASGTCVAERPTKQSAQAATDQPPNRPVHRSNERSTDQLTQHCAHFTTKARRESTSTNRTLGPCLQQLLDLTCLLCCLFFWRICRYYSWCCCFFSFAICCYTSCYCCCYSSYCCCCFDYYCCCCLSCYCRCHLDASLPLGHYFSEVRLLCLSLSYPHFLNF